MGLTNYEKQYMKALIDIRNNGYEDGKNKRTGLSTKRLPGVVIRCDVEKEFPILKSKFVAGITALREILWIWQARSNNIHDLNAHIWDSWADGNGSIGGAYGFQANKPVNIYLDPIHKNGFRSYECQAKYILGYLKEQPTGRWGVATLWNVNDLASMNLVPCCHTTTWNLDGGRLNCVLDQRSGDMPYGVPFNTTQYAELMILFAKDLGVQPGILTHVIADAHIYENQMDGVDEQIAYYNLLYALDSGEEAAAATLASIAMAKHNERNTDTTYTYNEIMDLAKKTIECDPQFTVDWKQYSDFFDVKQTDCHIKDYVNMGKIDFGDVAV